MESDAILRRYTSLPILVDMLVRSRLTIIGFDHWADANDRRALELYRDKLRYGFVGAMCLTMAPETFHHWQIFAQGESGVCVVLDRLALERALADLPNFIAGPVEYVQLNAINGIDAGDIHRLPFLKRYGFRDEREYRLLGFAPDASGSMSVELTTDLVRRVTFGPSTHPAVVDSLRIALRALPGWRNLRVGRSNLTSNETWLEALERIVERHGMVYGEWLPIGPGDLPDDVAPS